MEYTVLIFHMLISVPMVYFIWKDGYNKGKRDAYIHRIKK